MSSLEYCSAINNQIAFEGYPFILTSAPLRLNKCALVVPLVATVSKMAVITVVLEYMIESCVVADLFGFYDMISFHMTRSSLRERGMRS